MTNNIVEWNTLVERFLERKGCKPGTTRYAGFMWGASVACELLGAQLLKPGQQAEPALPAPIDMVLHCPACGLQHIDKDNSDDLRIEAAERGFVHGSRDWEDWIEKREWSNPPHRSHLCSGCGHVWRPADVPTNGVAAVKTKRKADSPLGKQDECHSRKAAAAELRRLHQECEALRDEQYRRDLQKIGSAIGFGNAQAILGELWDAMLEAEYGISGRGQMGVTIDDALPPLPKAMKLRREMQPLGGYRMVPAYTPEEMKAFAHIAIAKAAIAAAIGDQP